MKIASIDGSSMSTSIDVNQLAEQVANILEHRFQLTTLSAVTDPAATNLPTEIMVEESVATSEERLVGMKLGICVYQHGLSIPSIGWSYVKISHEQGSWQLLFETIKQRAFELYGQRIPLDHIQLAAIDKASDHFPITNPCELELAYLDAQPGLVKIYASHDDCTRTSYRLCKHPHNLGGDKCGVCFNDDEGLTLHKLANSYYSRANPTVNLCEDCLQKVDAPSPMTTPTEIA
ncbi:hypothetical protein MPSEU_000845800 [Mayamaea pseudoterrestris]|nr:hypothetical protein MPSEU_000845800 [Mayamaea pseudoterrestris]